jgi:hypothetical protein
MIELSFFNSTAWCLQDTDLLDNLIARWQRLRTNIAKLLQAGWSVRPTMSGLAITPPPEFCSEHATDFDEAIADYFATLGIEEEGVKYLPTRTLPEVYALEHECFDRIDYDRGRATLFADPSSTPRASRLERKGLRSFLHRMEQVYGRESLTLADDFERGVLYGRVPTLKWMQGDCDEGLRLKRPVPLRGVYGCRGPDGKPRWHAMIWLPETEVAQLC